MAAAEKLGSVAPFVVAPIDALTHVITDDSISAEHAAAYNQKGVQLIKPKTTGVS